MASKSDSLGFILVLVFCVLLVWNFQGFMAAQKAISRVAANAWLSRSLARLNLFGAFDAFNAFDPFDAEAELE